MMRKQEKAQAGMEYLLILGTAVLVTAVVIMSVPSSLNTGKTVIVDSNTAVVSSLDKLRELEMGSGTYSNP